MPSPCAPARNACSSTNESSRDGYSARPRQRARMGNASFVASAVSSGRVVILGADRAGHIGVNAGESAAEHDHAFEEIHRLVAQPSDVSFESLNDVPKALSAPLNCS